MGLQERVNKKQRMLLQENTELLEQIERQERYIDAFDKKCDSLQDLIDEMLLENNKNK